MLKGGAHPPILALLESGQIMESLEDEASPELVPFQPSSPRKNFFFFFLVSRVSSSRLLKSVATPGKLNIALRCGKTL